MILPDPDLSPSALPDLGHQAELDQGGSKPVHVDLGHIEEVRDPRGGVDEVVGYLAGQSADRKSHRLLGHRDHLWNVLGAATAQAQTSGISVKATVESVRRAGAIGR